MSETITTKEDSLDLQPFDAGIVVKNANEQNVLAPYVTQITPKQGIGSYVLEVQDTDGAFVPEDGVKPLTSEIEKVRIGNAKIIASYKITDEAKASKPEIEDAVMRSFPGQITRAMVKTVLGLKAMPVGEFDPDFYTLSNIPEIVISDQAGATIAEKALTAFDKVFENVTGGEVSLLVFTTRALAVFAGYRNTTTGSAYFTVDRVNKTINGFPYEVVKSTEFAIWAGDFKTLYQGVAVWDNGAQGTKLYTEFFGNQPINNGSVWVQEVFAGSGTSDDEAIVKIVLSS